jgi:hypothetical protein
MHEELLRADSERPGDSTRRCAIFGSVIATAIGAAVYFSLLIHRKRGRASAKNSDMTDERNQSIDTAWRIFGASSEWHSRLDVKAGFTLTADTALLAGAIALTKDKGVLAGLPELSRYCFYIGAFCIVVSLWSAIGVVAPVTRPAKDLKIEASNGKFIYIGNLKFLGESKILDYLNNNEMTLPALAKELKNISAIGWLKHVLLSLALFFMFEGVVLFIGTLVARHESARATIVGLSVATLIVLASYFVWRLPIIRKTLLKLLEG